MLSSDKHLAQSSERPRLSAKKMCFFVGDVFCLRPTICCSFIDFFCKGNKHDPNFKLIELAKHSQQAISLIRMAKHPIQKVDVQRL